MGCYSSLQELLTCQILHGHSTLAEDLSVTHLRVVRGSCRADSNIENCCAKCFRRQACGFLIVNVICDVQRLYFSQRRKPKVGNKAAETREDLPRSALTAHAWRGPTATSYLPVEIQNVLTGFPVGFRNP